MKFLFNAVLLVRLPLLPAISCSKNKGSDEDGNFTSGDIKTTTFKISYSNGDDNLEYKPENLNDYLKLN